MPVSCFLPATTTQRKKQRSKAKETSGASRLLRKQDDPAYWKEHDPANLARFFCFNLPRSPHPANLTRACDVGTPILIYLEGRVVLLIKRSMVPSRAFFSLPSSCLFEFKAKAKEQSKTKRTRLSLCLCSVRSFLLIQRCLILPRSLLPTCQCTQTDTEQHQERDL